MSKTLMAMLFPFLHTFYAVDPAPEAPPAEPNAEPAPAEGTAPEEQTPEVQKTFTQEELDAIVQKRVTKLERKLERQRIEAETRAKVQSEQSQHVETPSKPKSDDFPTYDEYMEALADWKADEKLRQRDEERKQREESERSQFESNRVNDRIAEIIEEGSKKYDDFEDMPDKTSKYLNSKGLKLSLAFVNSLQEAENAPDIIAHLANDLDEAERIARLPAYAQAKEVGKLEDRLSAKKPVQVSKAPEPVKPIDGGKTFTKRLEDMSYEEMKAHDQKRGARYLR